MKKSIFVLAGIAVLVVSGYAAGQFIYKKDSKENFVELEDGRMMRVDNVKEEEFDREGERPDVIGRIKSIGDDSIVVEKFEMSNVGNNRDEGGMPNGEAPVDRSERPEPTVSGEVTIILADESSYVKGPERGMGMRGGETREVKLEEISKNDLGKGDMISVWLSEDGENIVERIMVR